MYVYIYIYIYIYACVSISLPTKMSTQLLCEIFQVEGEHKEIHLIVLLAIRSFTLNNTS